MKLTSTLFLKIIVSLLGIAVLALCIFALPAGIMSDQTGMYRPILIGMYITAIPFFIALHQVLKLLAIIDTNKAFSQRSVGILNRIKYCGFSICGLYALGMPYIFMAADKDDAPGVVLIGLVITFASLVIAIFSTVLQKLLQNAIDIKSENDLTV